MSYYSSQEWKILRDYVVDRDNYTCQECGYHKHNEEDRELNAHHVIPRKKGGIDHPENLVTLCKRCHGKLEGERRNPRNPDDALFEDFIDWCSEDSLKRIVDEEIGVEASNYYQKIVYNNESICSNCHEFEYSIDSKDVFIQTDDRRIEKGLEFLVSKRKRLDVEALEPIENGGNLCFSCDQTDENWEGDEHISKNDFFDLSHPLRDFLEKSTVDFDVDLFYSTIGELKSKPDMQRSNRKIIEKAVENSVKI